MNVPPTAMRRAQHTRMDAAMLNCEGSLDAKNTGPWRCLSKKIEHCLLLVIISQNRKGNNNK